MKVLFGQRLTRMSKTGISLSWSNSVVNLMLLWRLLRYFKHLSAVSLLSNIKKVWTVILLKMYVVQHTKRQVHKMHDFKMFITAVCVIFLIVRPFWRRVHLNLLWASVMNGKFASGYRPSCVFVQARHPVAGLVISKLYVTAKRWSHALIGLL